MKLYGAQTYTAQELLAAVLRKEYGWERVPEIARTDQGKPYFPEHPNVHFNFSHTRGMVLCAVSDTPVGVDIEGIRPRRKALSGYVFTPSEQRQYQELGGDWPAFYTLWTRKEAWCKYTGQGLQPLWKQDPPDDLCFAQYGGETWRAAVCAETPPPLSITWWEGVCPL